MLECAILDEDTAKLHIHKNGFRPNYYQWSYDGELNVALGVESGLCTLSRTEDNSIRDMVMVPFGPMSSNWVEEGSSNAEEDPNREMKAFFDIIQAAKKPLYDGYQSSILLVL